MTSIITYLIYFLIAAGVTVLVGRDLHRNGYFLILDLFQNLEFTKNVNNLLLTGYYLLNVGYIAITVSQFGALDNTIQMLEELSSKIGAIVLILGVLHFNNIIVLHELSRKKELIIKYINT